MSQTLNIKAEVRGETGTHFARKIRKQGKLPVVLYGHKKQTVHLTVEGHEFESLIRHHTRVLDVSFGGQKETALIREVQYDTYGREILHVDLIRVDPNERVTVSVKIAWLGVPLGVSQQGGVIHHNVEDIQVEAPVLAIPDEITVDVSNLNIGDSLTAGSIGYPEGVRPISAEGVLCTVHEPRKVEEPVAGAEGAPAADGTAAAAKTPDAKEPELVGKKKDAKED